MRIEKAWKDKAYVVVKDHVNAPGYQHPSDRELVLSVAKALRAEFERGKENA